MGILFRFSVFRLVFRYLATYLAGMILLEIVQVFVRKKKENTVFRSVFRLFKVQNNIK